MISFLPLLFILIILIFNFFDFCHYRYFSYILHLFYNVQNNKEFYKSYFNTTEDIYFYWFKLSICESY
jgi:hypothetical protein